MDERRDPGEFYPGGRVMVRPDVAPPQMQVRWSDIQGKPDLSDVAELGEEATRGEMKQTMNTVINKLKTTLLIGALFVVGSAVADVEPLFAKADDIPGNQQVMTNAQEYIDAKVARIPAPDFSTNNTELVATIEAVAPAPGDYEAVSNAAMNAQYKAWYPDGSVTNAAQFTRGIRYDFDDATRTATVKPFAPMMDIEDCNADITGAVVIPPYVVTNGTTYTVVAIGDGALGLEEPKPQVTSVVAPTTVTRVGECAFYYADRLVSVVIPSATHIGMNAFTACPIKSASFPYATELGVFVFAGCSLLEEVEIPSAVSVGEYAFEGCSELKHISLHSFDSVSTANMFANCGNLQYIDFGPRPRRIVPTIEFTTVYAVPTSVKVIVPTEQISEWEEESVEFLSSGYSFTPYSDWEYARRGEVSSEVDAATELTPLFTPDAWVVNPTNVVLVYRDSEYYPGWTPIMYISEIDIWDVIGNAKGDRTSTYLHWSVEDATREITAYRSPYGYTLGSQTNAVIAAPGITNGFARLYDLTNFVVKGKTGNASTTAIGDSAVATNGQDTAIGFKAKTGAYQALAAGEYTSALSPSATSVGSKAYAKGDPTNAEAQVSVGFRTVATGNRAIAIGGARSVSDGSGDYPGDENWSATKATGDGGIAIGKEAKSLADGAIQLGQGSNTTAYTMSVFNYPLVAANGTIVAERLPMQVYDIELLARLSKMYQDSVTKEWFEFGVSNGVTVLKSVDILDVYDVVWRKIIANKDVTAFGVYLSEEDYGADTTFQIKAKISVWGKGPRIIDWGDGSYSTAVPQSAQVVSHTYPSTGYYLIQGTEVDFMSNSSSNKHQHAIVKAYKLSSMQDTAYHMFSWSSIKSLEGFSWGGCINAADCFYRCRSLAGKVPSFTGTHVTQAQYAFDGTHIQEIGEDFSWGSVTNANYTFRGCSSITNVASTLTAEVLMPSSVSSHSNCVNGAAQILRSHFTPDWGGTKTTP